MVSFAIQRLLVFGGAPARLAAEASKTGASRRGGAAAWAGTGPLRDVRIPRRGRPRAAPANARAIRGIL
jgi:hypothetical protein